MNIREGNSKKIRDKRIRNFSIGHSFFSLSFTSLLFFTYLFIFLSFYFSFIVIKYSEAFHRESFLKIFVENILLPLFFLDGNLPHKNFQNSPCFTSPLLYSNFPTPICYPLSKVTRKLKILAQAMKDFILSVYFNDKEKKRPNSLACRLKKGTKD